MVKKSLINNVYINCKWLTKPKMILFQSLKAFSDALKQQPEYSSKEGEKDVNRKKNRYKDILPCKIFTFKSSYLDEIFCLCQVYFDVFLCIMNTAETCILRFIFRLLRDLMFLRILLWFTICRPWIIEKFDFFDCRMLPILFF